MGHKRTFRTGVLIVDYIPRDETPGGVSDTIEDIMGTIDDLAQHLVPDGATVRERLRNRHRYWFSAQVDAVDDQTEVDIVALAVELMRVRADVWNAQPSFQLLAAQAVLEEECEKPVGEQWGMDAIQAKAARDIESGQENVLIAIIDSGIELTPDTFELMHEDFDRSRFLDGADYAAGKPGPIDENGHGTRMTGVIAANSGNDVGLEGLNQGSFVYPCRAFVGGVMHTERLSLALSGTYAAAFGTYLNDSEEYVEPTIPGIERVVFNLSLYETDYELANEHLKGFFQDLHDDPEQRKALFCCAMGNEAVIDPRYPASYATLYPELIVAVGGTALDGAVPPEEVFDEAVSCFGDHLTFLAPGKDIWTTHLRKTNGTIDKVCYETVSMTSIATAMASGVASLVWSRCAALDSARIVEILCKTAELPPDLPSEDANKWGHGRINAYLAVPDVKPTVDTVIFPAAAPGETVEVPLPLEIKSCIDLHFYLEGAGLDASPFRAGEGQFQENGVFDDYQPFDGLVVGYEGTEFEGADSLDVVVKCQEFGDKWSLPLRLAGVTATGKTHLALVLDKSGSMTQDAGVPDKTRMEVQQFSAGVIIDYMSVGDRISLAAFNEDAEALTSLVIADPPAAGPSTQDTLRADVNALVAAGMTSIGDGLVTGGDALNAESGYDRPAILVLTDGQENADPKIVDVTNPHRTYAIGIGTPADVDADNLDDMTGSGDVTHTLVTGGLDADTEFLVAKFMLQIVTDLSGGQVLLDPTDRIAAGDTPSVPFHVTAADRRLEVCVLAPAREVVSLSLLAPDGTEFDAGHHAYRAGENISYFRLPLVDAGSGLADERAHVGQWHARLRVDEAKLTDHMESLDPESAELTDLQQNGVPYTVLVNVESNLSLRCALSQDGSAPGAEMRLEARVSLSGAPLDKDVDVEAHITLPGRGEVVERLKQVAPGRYVSTPRMESPGVYRCRLTASGEIHGDQPFTREQVRTGYVNVTRPRPPLVRKVLPTR